MTDHVELRELLNACLQLDYPDWSALRTSLNCAVDSLSVRDKILARTAQRMVSAFQTRAPVDGVVLLRQLVRAKGALSIPPAWWAEIRDLAEPSGVLGLAEGGQIVVSARPWEADWLEASKLVDRLELRSRTPLALGDGMLNAMRSAWTEYRSDAQKAAVDAWMFAPPGSTTLVTLPTGAGKSLCTILPAWFDSRGGQVNSGTSLVVVPTVALAFDQMNQACSFFRGVAQPQCRTGANTARERMDIEASLRDGSLPLLFTSPESLIGTRLHDTCLDAAADGLITRFVIDEAHLIESWGAGFRPEFQLLAAFRRRMLERSQGNLRTLLLSATISSRSREVLEQLFCDDGQLITVQANRLRPEIAYWFNSTPFESTRNQRVLEALRFLPRPLILYVTRPTQAQQWIERLRAEGYQRIGSFTGLTQGEDRQSLLDAWMNDQLDIMVGTSAFGLGVDKSDVRAVVHATLPENLDRMYQEVGRTGRDGYSATALLATCREDIDLAYSLSPKRITVEKAWPRWRAMLSTPNRANAGDLRIVNREALPPDSARIAAELDRDWNDHILLILQRAGAIEVVEQVAETQEAAVRSSLLVIRVLDTQILDDLEYFRDIFEYARSNELGEDPTGQILKLAQAYSADAPATCLARRFADIYDQAQLACGGCASCRSAQSEAYGGDTLEYQVTYPAALAAHVARVADPPKAVIDKLGAWRSLITTWSGPRNVDSLRSMMAALPMLLSLGFQQFIIPDALYADREEGARLIEALAEQDQRYTVYPHRVIPTSWFLERRRTPLFPLYSVVVYPPDDDTADKLVKTLKSAAVSGVCLPGCIHIVHESLFLRGVGKLFVQHVDGLTEPMERLMAWLEIAENNVY